MGVISKKLIPVAHGVQPIGVIASRGARLGHASQKNNPHWPLVRPTGVILLSSVHLLGRHGLGNPRRLKADGDYLISVSYFEN